LVGTSLLGATSSYAALPSTTAVATAIAATAVLIATSLRAEVTAADPDAKVGARSAVLWRAAGGSTALIRFLGVHLSSGRRDSTYHSLRSLVACYPILRKGAPERSPCRASHDDLDDSSYQQRLSVCPRSEPELDPGVADRPALYGGQHGPGEYIPAADARSHRRARLVEDTNVAGTQRCSADRRCEPQDLLRNGSLW
jgi:hypothetical protein